MTPQMIFSVKHVLRYLTVSQGKKLELGTFLAQINFLSNKLLDFTSFLQAGSSWVAMTILIV